MLTFTQLVNLLTSNGKYSWFVLADIDIASLTPEELAQLKITPWTLAGYKKCFYPVDRYYRELQPEHRARLIAIAIEESNFEEVKRLQTTKGKE